MDAIFTAPCKPFGSGLIHYGPNEFVSVNRTILDPPFILELIYRPQTQTATTRQYDFQFLAKKPDGFNDTQDVNIIQSRP